MKKKTWIIVGGASLALALGGTGVAVAATAGDDDALKGSSLEKASDAAIAETGGGTVVGAETSDDADHAYELEVRAPDGTETDVELDANYGVVRTEADSDDDSDNSAADDAPISAADRASVGSAAIAAAGGGTVVDLERSDDAGIAWEIEVRAADGTETDVELDANLGVVTSQVDTDTDGNDTDDNDGEVTDD